MNDPMTILKRDHREVKAMLQELAESSPGRARNATFDKVERALSLHMQIEETLLYPLVRKEEGAKVAEEADNEHTLARETMARSKEMLSTPGFGAAISSLLGGILHHVKEEEKEILPQLKERLDRTEWAALGDEIARAKAQGEKSNGRSRSTATAGAR